VGNARHGVAPRRTLLALLLTKEMFLPRFFWLLVNVFKGWLFWGACRHDRRYHVVNLRALVQYWCPFQPVPGGVQTQPASAWQQDDEPVVVWG